MPIQPIGFRRFYLQIADQIRSLIAAGEFPPGSRLPAERELAKRFGVSRPSVREGLIALEVQGYVDVRPGSGIVVTTPKGLTEPAARDEGPLEILRARRLIEGEIAAEAAKFIKPNDIAALEQILLAMEGLSPNQPAALLAADRQFHLYIAGKLANKVLLRLVTELLDQRDGALARQFAWHFDNAKTWKAVSNEHRETLAALAKYNPDRARKAMRDHLRKAHSRWAQELDRGSKGGFNNGAQRLSTETN